VRARASTLSSAIRASTLRQQAILATIQCARQFSHRLAAVQSCGRDWRSPRLRGSPVGARQSSSRRQWRRVDFEADSLRPEPAETKNPDGRQFPAECRAEPKRPGITRSVAMKMVGHKTEAIYRRYVIVDEAMLREGAARLAEASGHSVGHTG
jgi:hypothetical protein